MSALHLTICGSLFLQLDCPFLLLCDQIILKALYRVIGLVQLCTHHFFVSSFLIQFSHSSFSSFPVPTFRPTQLCNASTSIALTLYCTHFFSLFVHHADDDSAGKQKIDIADTDASQYPEDGIRFIYFAPFTSKFDVRLLQSCEVCSPFHLELLAHLNIQGQSLPLCYTCEDLRSTTHI